MALNWQAVDNLKVIGQADGKRTAVTFKGPVIIPTAIAKAMPAQIKSDSRHHNQVDRADIGNLAFRRFGYSETAGPQLVQRSHPTEYQGLIDNPRVINLRIIGKSGVGKYFSRHFVVDCTVESQRTGLRVIVQGKQTFLNLQTECEAGLGRTVPAPGKQGIPDRAFGHSRDPAIRISGGEVVPKEDGQESGTARTKVRSATSPRVPRQRGTALLGYKKLQADTWNYGQLEPWTDH